MAVGDGLSLRERKKLRTRNDLAAAALRLFTERGFDQVTIDDIAAAVEVSPSTFVRYFERKEDVLLSADADRVDDLRAAMAARPADEPPLVAVRHALVALVDAIDLDRDAMLARGRIISQTPSLRARSLEHQTHVEQALAQAVGDRLGADPASDVRVRVIAASSIAAVRVAFELWLAANADQQLSHYLNDALELLDAGLNAAVSA
jgi:AcrR family transcriptional regulator